MGQHSVAEAKNNLSKLIDLALAGEEVVITRHGHPVAELRPVERALRRARPDMLQRLRAGRVGSSTPVEDSATLVSRMRDESEK